MDANDTSLDQLVIAVRAMAKSVPDEDSAWRLRDDFAWHAEQALRLLRTGGVVGFTAVDLHYNLLVTLARWAKQDLES